MSDLLDGIVEPDVPGTALATIETANFALIFEPEGIQKVVASIKDEVRRQAALLDPTKAKDRAALVSLGYKVATSKTAMDEGGKKLNEDANQRINRVNADRRLMREEMDALKAETIAPVELYKKTLAEREAANNDAIAAMEAMLDGIADLSSADIRQRAETIPTFDYAPEFQIKAAKVRASVVAQLTVAYQTAKAREDEIEASRIAEHHRNLAKVTEAANFDDSWSSDIRIDDIINRIGWLNGWKDHDWAEFAAQGVEAIAMSIAKLDAMREYIEAIQETERQAREEQIAREAAAEATRLAEQKAAQETEMARQAAQALLDAAADREREQAERLAEAEAIQDRMERARVLRHEEAIAQIKNAARIGLPQTSDQIQGRINSVAEGWGGDKCDWQEFAEAAAKARASTIETLRTLKAEVLKQEESDRIARERAIAERERLVAEATEQQRVLAAEKAEREKQAAVEAERQRVAHETAAQKAEDDRRAADKAHRGRINRAAMTGVMATLNDNWKPEDELSPEILARKVIEAIAKGEISHVTINYSARLAETGVLL